MSLFDNYKQLDTQYVPNNRPKHHKPKFIENITNSLSNKWPLMNAKHEFLGYEWVQGNEIILPFDIRGNALTSEGDFVLPEEFFKDKLIKFDIVDHLYNTKYSIATTCEPIETSEGIVLLFTINRNVSNLLERGTYHIRLTLVEENIVIYSPQDSCLVVY